jgi:hypothetical protein
VRDPLMLQGSFNYQVRGVMVVLRVCCSVVTMVL